MTLRIANAAGFLGDSLDAPRRLVQGAEVDFLTLEYLAELTLSILARQREKDPRAGFAGDFLTVLRSVEGELKAQPQLRIVTNAGGVNPLACAAEAARILVESGQSDIRLGVVWGDDLLADPRFGLRGGGGESSLGDFPHLDSGQPLGSRREAAVCANAYLGAEPIAGALAAGARIVITGRVADASLTVGPAVHHFQWSLDDYPRISGATVAGHLIECGAQVTGGYSNQWRGLNLADVGYPIAEIESGGAAVITKPPNTGGEVSRRTVAEQLVYEIGDPAHYLTPDVDADFTTVEIEDLGEDRVRVRGGSGGPPPDSYKVSLAYQDGYWAAGELLVLGRDAAAKAKGCANIVRARLKAAGATPRRFHVELLGAGGCGGETTKNAPASSSPRELVLRIAAADPRREVVERFARELAPLITSGPAGLAGYASGLPRVRPQFAYWPTTIAKSAIAPQVRVLPARQWAEAAGLDSPQS